MNFDIFNYHTIHPFESFDLTHPFWTLHLDTLIYTWAAMLLFFSLIIVARTALKKGPNKISILFETIIRFFMNTTQEAFGYFEFRYFAFATSLFLFTFFCCFIGVFPFLDEATKDLNTTLALGLSSFCFVQYHKIRTNGLLHYLKEYLEPFFLMMPINVVGELAKIASMSFRLFGNILGGGVVFMMMIDFLEGYASYFFALGIIYFVLHTALGYFNMLPTEGFLHIILKSMSILIFALAWAQLFFGVFEGLIQSFVIMMLTLTYLSMGIPQPEQQIHSGSHS
ncbi:F0F1 ATP synthase subunit A [Candidatus Dependentiae bacterium]|nr:F0F1 ATP synthase subunit A [Candidatus Dependentiae bacterium]